MQTDQGVLPAGDIANFNQSTNSKNFDILATDLKGILNRMAYGILSNWVMLQSGLHDSFFRGGQTKNEIAVMLYLYGEVVLQVTSFIRRNINQLTL
jgi:hypothetical protein